MTLVEIAIAVAILGLMAAGAMAALTVLNKNAASARLMSNASEIVQRNIEAAIGSPFTSSTEPDILKQHPRVEALGMKQAGAVPSPFIQAATEPEQLQGILTRIVTAESNSPGADIRRVTFRLDYSRLRRPFRRSLLRNDNDKSNG